MTELSFPRKLLDALRAARRLVALTGAGVSAESGLPTFREAQTGLWAHFRPEELATPAAFTANPRLVWEWYVWRHDLAAQAVPNAAHRALAAWEQRVPGFTLITQNVDGLHQEAGSRNIVELHGSLRRSRCVREDAARPWPDTRDLPPPCPECGALLRPDVVWFGESLPPAALAEAVCAAETCDVLLSIGTSGVVEPAASLPRLAAQKGAVVVFVNPDAPEGMTRGSHLLRGPAGDVLPALLYAAWPEEKAQ